MTARLPIDLIIFDCDGVLVDSEPIANPLLSEALRAEGLDISLEETVRLFVGHSMDYVQETVEQRLGRPLPGDFLDRLQAKTFDTFRADLMPMGGAADIVRAVQDMGLKTCVASNGNLEKMSVSLGVTGLIDLFQGQIFSRQMVARGKPAPDLFLYAASEMGVAPDMCLVVEDSNSGIAAAKAAGMQVVQFKPGEGDRASAVPVLSQLVDLLDLIK